MANYGEVISKNRKELNLTQKALADLLYVSPQAVSKWENNLSEPDLETLKKLSQIFGITLETFFNEKEEKQTALSDIFECSLCGKSYRAFELYQLHPTIRCRSCHEKLVNEALYIKNQQEQIGQTASKKRMISKINPYILGMITGLLVFILMVVNDDLSDIKRNDFLLSGVVFGVLSMTLSTQLFYETKLKKFIRISTFGFQNNPWFSDEFHGLLGFIFVQLFFGTFLLLLNLGIFFLFILVAYLISPFMYFYELIIYIFSKEKQ